MKEMKRFCSGMVFVFVLCGLFLVCGQSVCRVVLAEEGRGLILLEDFEDLGEWVKPGGRQSAYGSLDKFTGATGNSFILSREKAHQGSFSGKLTYAFGKCEFAQNANTVFLGVGRHESLKLKKKPEEVELWFYGDGTDNIRYINFRIVDATGEVFEYSLAKCPLGGWQKKWYCLKKRIGKHSSHWGGNNDGVLDAPIYFARLRFRARRISEEEVLQGAVYIDELRISYEPKKEVFVKKEIDLSSFVGPGQEGYWCVCKNNTHILYVALESPQSQFTWKRKGAPPSFFKDQYTDYRFTIEVPAQFELLDQKKRPSSEYFPRRPQITKKEIVRDSIPYHQYTLSFSKPFPYPGRGVIPHVVPLCFRIGDTPFKETMIYYYSQAKREGKEVREKEKSLYVTVLPPLKGMFASKFNIGVTYSAWGKSSFQSDEEMKSRLTTFKNAGINTLFIVDKPYADFAHKEGFKLIGYVFTGRGVSGNKVAGAINMAGEPAKKRGKPRPCPAYLMNEGSNWLKESFARRIKDYHYAGFLHCVETYNYGPNPKAGCYCPRCLEEFRKFAKLPGDEVLTPQVIKEKYHDNKWTDFWTEYYTPRFFCFVRKILKQVDPDAKLYLYGGHAHPGYRSQGCDWKYLGRCCDVVVTGGGKYNPPHYILDTIARIKEGGGKADYMAREMGSWIGGRLRTGNPSGTANRVKNAKCFILDKIATPGVTDGFRMYVDCPLGGYDFQVLSQVSNIRSDFSRMFEQGRMDNSLVKVQGSLLGAPGGVGPFINWVNGDERVLFLINVRFAKSRVKIRNLNLPKDRKLIALDYGEAKVLEELEEIDMELLPKDVKIIYIAPQKKVEQLLRRIKGRPGWEEMHKAFLKVYLQAIQPSSSQETAFTIKKAATAPVIDGVLDDTCWQKASKVTGFRVFGKAPAKEQTTAYVTYDKANLYIGFKCSESNMDKLKAVCTQRDSNVWIDDAVEIFLDTENNRGGYYQFLVNCIGTVWDGQDKSSSWNARWEAKTSRGDKYWAVEIAIPFNELGTSVPQPGKKWGFNFTRREQPHSEQSGFPTPIPHAPKLFGTFLFGE